MLTLLANPLALALGVVAGIAVFQAIRFRLALSAARGDVGTAQVQAEREKIARDRAESALVAEQEKVAALERRAKVDAVAFDAAQHRITDLEAKLLDRAQPGDGQAALAAGFGSKS